MPNDRLVAEQRKRIEKRTEELYAEFSQHRIAVKNNNIANKVPVSENSVSTYMGWSLQKMAAMQLMIADLAGAIVGLAKEVRSDGKEV